MATGQLSGVIQHLHRAMLLREGAGRTDGQLLEDYISRRDEAALAALVQRHGPMVWGVCRRVLSNYHDAEDAFQATFLVLVRRAASIASPELLANWLYGVAHQTAIKARATGAKRKMRERQVTEMPEPAVVEQNLWNDLQPLLDQELSRLPDKYRGVIVLCDLEGKTRKEAAGQLGCAEGTVASRLARARIMLAKRLTQRGVILSGGALAAVLSKNAASAGVPASVVMSTIKAANLFAAGQAVISSKVAALAEGVLKAMLLNKLNPALAVLVVVAMVGLIGYGIALGQQKGDRVAPQKQVSEKAEDAVVKEKAEQKDTTAWGKEVDGLQAGLLAEAPTCRLGDKLKFTVTLRNVGKAEIWVTYGRPRDCAPQVTTDTGGRVSVYMPPPLDGYSVPIKRTLKPGETITLYHPAVAVESEDRAKLLGEMLVWTPTICVAPGKYKIALGGMIHNHPKLATGTVEFEVKPASVTAWGKEFGGLQAGLGFRPGEKRPYTHGETVKLVVRVRNVSKEDVKFQYLKEFFRETSLAVTDSKGKQVLLREPLDTHVMHIPVEVNLAPGKEIELYERMLVLSPADGTGTVQIQYERVFGNSSFGRIQLDPTLSKLATGKLELEVKEKEAEKLPEKKQEKEGFTAWGKEFGGLQAGLGFRPGEKRPYTHGETVKLVVRVRNVNKNPLAARLVDRSVNYIPAYFVDWPPSVTDGEGKAAPQIRFPGKGGDYNRKQLTLAPGKEVELAEVRIELRPESERDKKGLNTLFGTGKFQIQYERVMYSSGKYDIGSILSDLATGKLDLEIKPAPPAEKK